MKGLFVVFAAIVAVSQSAPSRSFTAKEYEALQQALGDRIPVAIQSGIRILSAVETNPTDFVVLNFDGLSRGGGGPAPRTSVSVADSGISARTGAAAAGDDDVAETFSEVAEDAVESVREAAEDAAEAAAVDAINRSLNLDDTAVEPDITPAAPVTDDAPGATLTAAVTEDNTDTVTDNTAASATAEGTPETAEPTTGAASPTTTAAEATETSAVSRTGLAVDAEGEGEDAPAAAEEAADDITPAQVIAQVESARRKRQNDDQQNEYATSLSFALQFLGLELVPANEY